MLLVQDKAPAIVLLLAALACLGTWPICLHLAAKAGRRPSHTYLDFSLAFLMVAIVSALTLGQIGPPNGDTPNFFEQLRQHNGSSVGFAFAGGAFIMLGNLSLQYGIALVGMIICPSIQGALTLVVGATLNYFLDNRINLASFVFPAVACCLLAITCGALAHAEEEKSRRARDSGVVTEALIDSEKGEPFLTPKTPGSSSQSQYGTPKSTFGEDEFATPLASEASAGEKLFSAELRLEEATAASRHRTIAGLFFSVFGGICLGCFSPLFNLATNDQFHRLPEGVPPLGVYASFFYFTIGFYVTSVALNTLFLYYPMLGAQPSTVWGYLNDWPGRGWSFLSGTIVGLGNVTQFMGGQAVGYAAANIAQAHPLVTTIWAVVLFGEFRRSNARVWGLIVLMFALYIVAIGLLSGSVRQTRAQTTDP